MNKISTIISISILLFFSVNCKKKSNSNKFAQGEAQSTAQVEVSTNDVTYNNNTDSNVSCQEELFQANEQNSSLDYQIPTPETFVYKKANSKPNNQALYPITDISAFNSLYSKSIALGIYTADLTYVNSYKNSTKTLEYYNSIILLSNELGLGISSSSEVINNYLSAGNFDTVSLIINSDIKNIFKQLEDNKAYDEYPFVVYGSWVESVYLLTNTLIDNLDTPEEFNAQLAKQHTNIDNLINFLNSIILDSESFKLNNQITNIIYDLENIHDIFANSYNNPADNLLSIEELNTLKDELKIIIENITNDQTEVIEEID